MPLRGKSIGGDIKEFHKGKTYAKTAKKFGKKRANKQAIAVAFAQKRRSAKKKKAKK